MKIAYPVVFTQTSDGFVSHVPDFDSETQGNTLAEVIEMTRDMIGILGIDMQDDNEAIPAPSSIDKIKVEDGKFVSYVDIDFDEYRKRLNMKSVRRNVSLPSWLDNEAQKAGINVSAVLQNALKNELNKNRPS